MDTKRAFGLALRKVRTLRKMTQEDFSIISSRTYLSMLERGIKSPTLDKIEALASTLGVHPLTLIALTYLMREKRLRQKNLFKQVNAELLAITPE